MAAKFPIEEPICSLGKVTPLMYAASQSSDVKCLELLMNYGPNLQARDSSGRTVLHHACRGGVISNF